MLEIFVSQRGANLPLTEDTAVDITASWKKTAALSLLT